MWLVLNKESGISLSRQIYEWIKTLILHGELRAEEKLPSSRMLGKNLEVSRNTVLEAYDQLLAEGYLEARHGSGTLVAKGIATIQRNSGDAAQLPIQEARALRAKGMINFRSGIPALEAFPTKEWAAVYQRTCNALHSSALRYCEPAGIWELREAIAAYLFRIRGIRVPPRRVMITSGATQGLWLVSRLLYREGAAVLVEDPAHRGLVEVVARAGYDLKGIRVDEHGMDTAALPPLGRDSATVAFVYTTPSHQYPLGGILPVQRRQALIRFAHDTGCFIVEDDYDSEFRYEGCPVSSLHELGPDEVIYLGSFSKILAPALRLGFAIVPDSLLQEWKPEKMYTDVHTDALTQYALAEFINSGKLERHIWKMKKLYRRKREHLMQNLALQFQDRFKIQGQSAGLHLVVGFTDVIFDEALIARLSEGGIEVVPVRHYSLCHDNAHHDHEIILGYSHLSEEEITQGIKILKDVLAAH